ncbi:transporter substrate-binding domain-containing protein [Vibrio sp. 03-59-1]|uniref:GGDEF domain-containing protein n=1 Tax=Vibrio sp. 03-59-1 TaxID=2607607 RepID=UPI0014937E95|nr:GGDEF domain-containing protein [Vibrio sp. 03-59-1]NOH84251.1 transporter substrate-binding domain-containing protein [Vibrio sp. 03-59-1]
MSIQCGVIKTIFRVCLVANIFRNLRPILWFVVWVSIGFSGVFHATASESVPQSKMHYSVATEADDIVTRILFDALAEEFELSIQYVDYPSFDSILRAVEVGESDFAANITHTKSRSLRFDFSRPTNIEYTFLYSRLDTELADISKLGVPKNTIYGDLIQVNYPQIELIEYDGTHQALALLNNHSVAGVVDAINQLEPMLSRGFDAKMLNDKISIKPVSIVSMKGTHASELSYFVDYLHSEKIQKRLREKVEQYQFDLRQQALRREVFNSGLDLRKPLLVKLENMTPFAIYQPDGSAKGNSADAIFQACDILGFQCQLVSSAEETWESMYQDLLMNRIDVLAPLNISEPRKALVNFSTPHYTAESLLVKRIGYKPDVYRNASELITENIGVIKGDFFDELLTQLLPQKYLFRYRNDGELVDALLDAEVDYIALNNATLSALLKEKSLLPITRDHSIDKLFRSDVALGFPKTDRGEKLAFFFSRALQVIDTDRLNRFYDQAPDWRSTHEAEQKLASRTQSVFIVLLCFMFLVAIYLHTQSNTDSLTKLGNRRSLRHRYRRGLKPSQTLVYLDINKFKQINDTYGHHVGDLILQEYAQLIKREWQGRCFRIGGDEFILVGEVPEHKLSELLNRLGSFNFQRPKEQIEFAVKVSMGIYLPREGECSLREALRKTDRSMYDAKNSEGTEFMFVNPRIVVNDEGGMASNV